MLQGAQTTLEYKECLANASLMTPVFGIIFALEFFYRDLIASTRSLLEATLLFQTIFLHFCKIGELG